MVMAFILGTELEYSFGQTLVLAQGNLLQYIFLERPITAAIILATPVIAYLMWRRSVRLRQAMGERVSE
ncbi:MAG: hypothetical protein GTO62_03580 [Planctomycetales bacterium]|nr:hypothetical protein [Planctomycetales bacterium]